MSDKMTIFAPCFSNVSLIYSDFLILTSDFSKI